HGRPPNKRIKSSAENDLHNDTKTSISAINPYSSELTTRTPFHTFNNNSNNQADTLFDSSTKATQGINENTAK
ncbi:4979_t:CDS:2, partial [Dentiscutata heterogama]